MSLIEASLESGLGYSDAVTLAVGVYKEIDLLARDEVGDILNRTAIKTIRVYCRAILRSGSTFSSFEIATRAVAAWRTTLDELEKIHAIWDRETVAQRLKLRQIRKAAAAKSIGDKAEDVARGVIEIEVPDLLEEMTWNERQKLGTAGGETDPCTCSRETRNTARDPDDPYTHDEGCQWREMLTGEGEPV